MASSVDETAVDETVDYSETEVEDNIDVRRMFNMWKYAHENSNDSLYKKVMDICRGANFDNVDDTDDKFGMESKFGVPRVVVREH